MPLRTTPLSIAAVPSSSRSAAARWPLNSRLSVAFLEHTLGMECPMVDQRRARNGFSYRASEQVMIITLKEVTGIRTKLQ
jgi:hypothetical protein